MKNPFRKKQKRNTVYVNSSSFSELISSGFTPLDQCPEVIAGCRRIAELISSMTIYLMANTEKGDKRIVNELSKMVDIYPSKWMTRRTWMDAIVMNMLLYGKGNAIVRPHTSKGLLDELEIIDSSRFAFRKLDVGYDVMIDNIPHPAEDLLHFVYNPHKKYPWMGQGLTTSLKVLNDNLCQARTTEASFMNSKWKPSVIIKVDALADEFASPEGRRRLLNDYFETAEAGEPWLIPAEEFSVEQIRPLTLSDLAINDVVQMDKRTVASLLGVPAFVLGVGEYKKEEWDAFISNTIRPIAKEIEQELTRKLILSPKMYFMFNISSLYAYDLKSMAEVYGKGYQMGVITGNEYREKISLSPLNGLDELVILENYIPIDKIGEQKKLGGSNE